MPTRKVAVIAIGGNSLILSKDAQTVQDQYRALCVTGKHIVSLVELGYQVVVTYGNGPQVGFLLWRSEVAHATSGLHGLPLVTCVADTQGGIGYQIQQTLKNEFLRRGLCEDSIAVLTQVVVDKDDPGFRNPTKPVGEFYPPERAEFLRRENPSWVLREDAGRGFRRYVPSPRPLEIVEEAGLKTLRPGPAPHRGRWRWYPGVPYGRGYEGVDAVVDKDLTSCLLAKRIKSDLFVISTAVSNVAIHFGTPEQENISRMTVAEAMACVEAGYFAPGSMLPKVLAAVDFVRATGKEAIITSPENVRAAVVEGKGTHIVP
ncbi:MAG: carbamate kinase [Bilophila wadsworthia]